VRFGRRGRWRAARAEPHQREPGELDAGTRFVRWRRDFFVVVVSHSARRLAADGEKGAASAAGRSGARLLLAAAPRSDNRRDARVVSTTRRWCSDN
jgi:hypothetical protein